MLAAARAARLLLVRRLVGGREPAVAWAQHGYSSAAAAADEPAAGEAAAAAAAAPSTVRLRLAELAGTDDPAVLSQLAAALSAPLERAASPDAASPSERARELALFRAHNSSLPLGRRAAAARVLDVDRHRALLGLGVKTAAVAAADAAGAAPGAALDVFVEQEETPEGDMLVARAGGAPGARAAAVWAELERRRLSRRAVRGRVLNAVGGGFAVGVAGFVAFLPATMCSPRTVARIGELQDFHVVQTKARTRNVVLKEANWERQSGFAEQFPRGPRPPPGPGQQAQQQQARGAPRPYVRPRPQAPAAAGATSAAPSGGSEGGSER